MVNMQLWDIAGQERFGSMTRAYYRGASGAFVVYDVTRPATFQNAMKWKRDLDENGSCLPVVLLANKVNVLERDIF
jgi:GTPase SAR1 family protein